MTFSTSRNLPPSEVERAYRKKSLRVHPDKMLGQPEDARQRAEEAFKDLSMALRDKVTRARAVINGILADRKRAATRAGQGQAPAKARGPIQQLHVLPLGTRTVARSPSEFRGTADVIVQISDVVILRAEAFASFWVCCWFFSGDAIVRPASHESARSASTES